jgi:hypothetical protein
VDRIPAPTTDGLVLGPDVARAPKVPRIVFIGGTGRSGTHIIAQLLGRSHNLAMIPVEVRFHTDADGFPGLLAGEVSLPRFVRRLRGFWWKGFQTTRMRGMFRLLDRELFDTAVAKFESRFGDDPRAACRLLFFDLFWSRTSEELTLRGIVEQSCDTVAQAPTLVRLFPEARFVHVVRDGRDASASRVSQTHGLVRPRTRADGIRWWEERISRVEEGAHAIPPARLLTVSLDELLLADSGKAVKPLLNFCGTRAIRSVRHFYGHRMSRDQAHSERWREGISSRRAARLEELYEQALGRLEASGARSAPLLRRTFDRARDPGLPPQPYAYDGPSQ